MSASAAIPQRDVDKILGLVERAGMPPEVVRIGPEGPKINLLRISKIAGVSLSGINRAGQAGELQRQLDALALRSAWSDGRRRYIPTRNRPHGRDTSPGIVIDLGELKVSEGGLLDDLLAAFPVPAQHQQLQLLLRHVSALTSESTNSSKATIQKARKILGSRVAALRNEDAIVLAGMLERQLEVKPHSLRTRNEYVTGFFCQIATAFERSGKVRPRRAKRHVRHLALRGRGLVSDLPDEHASTLGLRPALVNVAIGSPTEVQEVAAAHLQDRLTRIEAACDAEIRGFAQWRKFLADSITSSAGSGSFAASLIGYSSSIAPDYRAWLEESDLSEIAAAMMDTAMRSGLHREREYHELRVRNQAVQLSNAYPRFCEAFPLLRHWTRNSRKRPWLTWVPLSYWYVPRCVQLAIEIKLQIATSWNRDTVRNIEANGIDARSWQICSLKNKTGKMQYGSIEGAGSVLRDGLQMMLDQDRAITEYWSRECPGLFVAPIARGGRFVFGKATDHKLLGRFIRWHRLPSFTREQLRNQRAASLYLKEQNPHLIQGLLGHENLATTTGYLRHSVISVLNRASIASFQRQLAASITWAIEGEAGLRARGMEGDEIDQRLLFPVSDRNIDEEWMSPACDVWMSKPELPLKVDPLRIQHLVRQRQYYAKNWQRLRAEHPERFESEHRPRIEFTAALWAVICDSPYGPLLGADP